ncbi:hypothetical protein VTK73DRAFT_4683 [Phialemonium thermophilum]|uniref:DNA-directed RNA polymerase III complex subunit Rpc37 n=1 Tax=Phialemonium thermophilum TaxID=223376 RepID=A0ABR3WT05_9PEZI
MTETPVASATTSGPTSMTSHEEDPVVASYSVFVKPPLPSNRKLMVLQHPNNHSEHPALLRSPPITELRVKPSSGMIEADVPIDYNQQYDRLKGMNWGAALHKSLAAKGGGSLGLAGGFGVGTAQARGRAGPRGREVEEVEGGDWAEAVRLDRVLRTQTLGGMSSPPSDANYMVGVFQERNIHLTPVSSVAHLRPQLHYIDAVAEQERLTRSSATGSGSGPGGSTGKDGAAGGPARAIHMTIKSAAGDGDDVVTETIADRLRRVQVEPWNRLQYADEDTEEAWNAYRECLFLRPDGTVSPVPAPSGATREDPGGATDLEGRVPQLTTTWGEDELLRGVSGIRAGDKKPGQEAVTDTTSATAHKGSQAVETPTQNSPRKRVGRPPRAAGAATAPRGSKGKKGNAMEVD